MRREGRQHGWVRTRMILPQAQDPKAKSRYINVLDAPPAAGIFVRAPAKPTNHSKFTGRCSTPACPGCRHFPSCKSSGKAKGAAKLRRLDATPGRWLGLHGSSAEEVVGQLTGEGEEGEGEGEEEEAEEEGVGRLQVEDLEGRREEARQEFEDRADDGDWFLVEHPLNGRLYSGSIQF